MLDRAQAATAWLLLCVLAALPLHAASADSGSATEAGAEQARRAQVIVAVEDAPDITVGELEDAINALPPVLRQDYQDMAKRRHMLDELLGHILLAREARKRGYAKEAIVQRRVDEAMVEQLIETAIDRKQGDFRPKPDEIAQYYEAHPELYQQPEKRRASHILVASRQQATELIAQARATDMRGFRELAQTHSLDNQTKLRGGDLGYFTRDGKAGHGNPEVEPAIAQAAFSLQELGQVFRKPVALGESWSIVKLTGKRPALETPLPEASAEIRDRLWQVERKRLITALLEQLARRYPVEIKGRFSKGDDI